ncbi:Purine permease [Teratosphaeria destructans]|uniref:Purine permease n=1 Tax=Teratosphaeria destructans TaxID=418781 RepID=A0A9W7SY26_9PEZI|nr:Purine permease [Teratosphaeria destructans]
MSTPTVNNFKDDGPDQIGPETTPRRSFGDQARSIFEAVTTRDGLIGTYDYGFLFKPNLPFMTKQRRAAPFFGLNDRMPVLLALLLGFQHALSMLAGIISPPIILASAANLTTLQQEYLVSTSLIVCGILSAVQITRFHIKGTPYYIGTGLISVVGTSFAVIPAARYWCVCFLVTATCDVSRLQVDGALFDSRIQGGVLADGLTGIIAGLCTITPMSTFAQNNGVIALTRCANRKAGYACCFWLLIMGIFAKFAAALVAIPSAVLGGMTTFLFSSVAVSGIRIISTVPSTRRNRFILTAALAPGIGAVLVPSWFSYVFTYTGNNHSLAGFYNAIVLVMEQSFAVTAFLALILNLILPEEMEDEDPPELTAHEADDQDDRDEWNRIHRGEGKTAEHDAVG